MPKIDSWLNGLNRMHQAATDCPVWPPDLFAICGSLLKISGAYLRIFERGGRDGRWIDAHTPGELWATKFGSIKEVTTDALAKVVPRRIRSDWNELLTHRHVAISDIKHEREVAYVLIRLTLAADAASGGLGVETEKTMFLSLAQEVLEYNDHQSFAWDVPRDVVCVLGKQHTPQRGATFRSLSHHLSLYWPNDIEGRWIGPYDRDQRDASPESVNLLLLPWPTVVHSEDFRVRSHHRIKGRSSSGRYFEYQPTGGMKPATFRRKLAVALTQARRHARRIDAVVFPESALSLSEYSMAEDLALKEKFMLIGGVRYPRGHREAGANLCVLQPAGLLPFSKGLSERAARKVQRETAERLRCVQSKHHRWCLNTEQILQYQLGGRIPPSDAVWEDIELPARVLHFVTLGHWMTWSVIICEDLARQDPVADLIRSVGPNLLITLLMDGPQLRERWPGRYASVLAEDPGTSVLTLTSLGMAERCRPTLRTTGRRAPMSRAVALWRDVVSGEQEIVLDEGDDACVLTSMQV